MDNKRIEKIIEEELTNLHKGWVALAESDENYARDVNLGTLRYLIEEGYTGVIISAYKESKDLIEEYKENGIDVGKIIIIDCVPHKIVKREKNIVHISSRTALDEIEETVEDALDALKGKNFVFLDSVTTMLIYNNTEDFERFIHNILTKIRLDKDNTGGILFSLEKGIKRDIRSEITQLCDKVIKI